MKTHFRLAAFVLMVGSLVSAFNGDAKVFFFLLAVALEIYSLTEMEIDWSEKFCVKNIPQLMRRPNATSTIGIAAQFSAYLCLAGFFISP